MFSTKKTHPIASNNVNEGFDLKSDKFADLDPGQIEVIVECKQIENAENSVRRTAFGVIGNHALDSNQFPSIERSVDIVITSDSQQIKLPSELNLDKYSTLATATREWAREKTFDGCPVFCVKFI